MRENETMKFFKKLVEDIKNGTVKFEDYTEDKVHDAISSMNNIMENGGDSNADNWLYRFVAYNMLKESIEEFDGSASSLCDVLDFNKALSVAEENGEKEKVAEYEDLWYALTRELKKEKNKDFEEPNKTVLMSEEETMKFFKKLVKDIKNGTVKFEDYTEDKVSDAISSINNIMYNDDDFNADNFLYRFAAYNMLKESIEEFDGSASSLSDAMDFNKALSVAEENGEKEKVAEYEDFLYALIRELKKEKNKDSEKPNKTVLMSEEETKDFFKKFVEDVKNGTVKFENYTADKVNVATLSLMKIMGNGGDSNSDNWLYFFAAYNMTKEDNKDFDGDVNSHECLFNFNQAISIAEKNGEKEKVTEYKDFLRALTREKNKVMKSIKEI